MASFCASCASCMCCADAAGCCTLSLFRHVAQCSCLLINVLLSHCRPCTRGQLGSAAVVSYVDLDRGLLPTSGNDSGEPSGAEAFSGAPSGKEKKKVGRPITYKGDVNSAHLTEAERRRIKRCGLSPSVAFTAHLVGIRVVVLHSWSRRSAVCRRFMGSMPAAPLQVLETLEQYLMLLPFCNTGEWPTGSRRGGCARSGRRRWRRCRRAWTRCSGRRRR